MTLEHRIDNIVDEWWKSSTQETFQAEGKFLKEKGLTDDEIIEMLGNLYSAVSGEYGN